MRKKYKLENLDCADCGAKMEAAIKKIEGVRDASISFMTQKLILEADGERFDEIISEARRICSKIEPDCKIQA